MDFPVGDVVKNVKHFMNLVKRATGNIRDPKTEKDKGGGPRPGKFLYLESISQTSQSALYSYSNHEGYSQLTARSRYTDLRRIESQ